MRNFVIIMIEVKNEIFCVSIKSIFLGKMNVGCYSIRMGRMFI